jgi:hypothetical protein
MPVYGWIHLPINMDPLLKTIRLFEEATKEFLIKSKAAFYIMF